MTVTRAPQEEALQFKRAASQYTGSLEFANNRENTEEIKASPKIALTGRLINSSGPVSVSKMRLAQRILPSGEAQHTAKGQIFRKTYKMQKRKTQGKRDK
jgi:hypothetical protein